MAELIRFPLAVSVAVQGIEGGAEALGHTDWWVATEWTDQAARVVTVNRTGGIRRNLVVDAPLILVECFGPSTDDAELMGQDVEAIVNSLPGSMVAGVAVHKVEWVSGPVSYPDEQGRPRVQLTFTLLLRGQAIQ